MIDIFYFDKTLKKGDIKELAKLKNKKIWMDITDITKEEADFIKKSFNLHPVTIEDITRYNTRIKVEEFQNYLFCVFYGIQNTKSIELVEMDFVLGNNFIISTHKKEIQSFNELKKNKEKLTTLFEKGTDYIFYKLLDYEIDNYFPILESIDDQLEDIEEEVTKKPRPEILSKILKLKRSLVFIKKTVFPQREKISFLAKNQYKFIQDKAIPYFRDIYDHSIRVSDSVDNYREALSNTFEVYMSAVSNSMNEVMKVLSVIATIALPLTVISSIYGTNFAILPGSKFVYGFWVMIFVMVLMSASMIYFFRRRGWF